MIPVEPVSRTPTFPCIARQDVRQRITLGWPGPHTVTVTKTAYVVVVSLPGMGPEYAGQWQLEGRSGYPRTPPHPMCTTAQTFALGVEVTAS